MRGRFFRYEAGMPNGGHTDVFTPFPGRPSAAAAPPLNRMEDPSSPRSIGLANLVSELFWHVLPVVYNPRPLRPPREP